MPCCQDARKQQPRAPVVGQLRSRQPRLHHKRLLRSGTASTAVHHCRNVAIRPYSLPPATHTPVSAGPSKCNLQKPSIQPCAFPAVRPSCRLATRPHTGPRGALDVTLWPSNTNGHTPVRPIFHAGVSNVRLLRNSPDHHEQEATPCSLATDSPQTKR